MNKKPANFSRSFYKAYSDKTWYYKVAEGVPGTRMPRWKLKLKPEQMWYLVAYLKTLPQESGEIIAPYQTIDDLQWEDQSAIDPRLADAQRKIGAQKATGTYKPNPGGLTGSEVAGGAPSGH
jgi:hypothetical protein